MRIQSGIVCVLAAAVAFAVACAESTSGEGDGDGDGSEQTQNVCGDGTCAASEVGYCTSDCGQGGNNNGPVCGNGTCEAGEDSTNCANDCGNGGGGGGGGGGGSCDPLECAFCLALGVCIPPVDVATCNTCLGGGIGDILCDGGAADGTCNPATEDNVLCPSDCP